MTTTKGRHAELLSSLLPSLRYLKPQQIMIMQEQGKPKQEPFKERLPKKLYIFVISYISSRSSISLVRLKIGRLITTKNKTVARVEDVQVPAIIFGVLRSRWWSAASTEHYIRQDYGGISQQ